MLILLHNLKLKLKRMIKFSNYLLAFVLTNIISLATIAQSNVISGIVKNASTGEKATAVSVIIKGTDEGTFTDDKGNYKITSKAALPITLIFSSVGYTTQEVVVSSNKADVSFVPNNALGQEVVVSASRVSQKILESPVSIERLSATAIRNAPSANFYDVVTTLKGVDVTTSSLTFKTPTTRGFNSSGNTRFNQLVDGMDNQAPGLNFSVGAIIGLSELDVDNIELLSGASSALYGPGGMNGTLLMTSKNPFKYQGLSFLVKTGIMHVDGKERPASPYYNWNVRYAKKIGENFAFKINTEFVQAKDWIGVDTRNYKRAAIGGNVVGGDRKTDPAYDGINIYGDETRFDQRLVYSAISASLPGAANFITTNGLNATPQNVTRTGFTEKDFVNPNTVNFKVSSSLHYKITPKIEAVLAGYWGTGNTIYTGSDRYSIKEFKMGQYKFELNHKNWMVRAYTTQERSGESFNMSSTAAYLNESFKPTPTWLPQYVYKYLSDRMSGVSDFDAQTAARAVADAGRPLPGSADFTRKLDSIRLRSIKDKGGNLVDKTNLYSLEGNYNLSYLTKDFADILVGANFRKYDLNSDGTLFADSAGAIPIKEYGAFIQATRKITDYLKVTASGRYDKNENFKGRFTPRVTAVIKVKENNNIRLSFQSAYRFPSTQQQWINLAVGSTRLIGGNPSFTKWLHTDTYPLYDANALSSGTVTVFNFPELKPESVNSFEVGYKGLLMNSKLLIDVYAYYGQYKDFLSRTNTVQDTSGVAGPPNGAAAKLRNISVPVNAPDKVKTNGFGIGLDYSLPLNFTIGANLASDELKDVPVNFTAYFNAPKYKTNLTFGNTGFGPSKRLSANVAYRWQQGFYYQGDFASGNLEDVHTLDAQLSLKMPATKSIIKLGATNLLNQYYYNGIGNSYVGGLYYISFGFNVY